MTELSNIIFINQTTGLYPITEYEYEDESVQKEVQEFGREHCSLKNRFCTCQEGKPMIGSNYSLENCELYQWLKETNVVRSPYPLRLAKYEGGEKGLKTTVSIKRGDFVLRVTGVIRRMNPQTGPIDFPSSCFPLPAVPFFVDSSTRGCLAKFVRTASKSRESNARLSFLICTGTIHLLIAATDDIPAHCELVLEDPLKLFENDPAPPDSSPQQDLSGPATPSPLSPQFTPFSLPHSPPPPLLSPPLPSPPLPSPSLPSPPSPSPPLPSPPLPSPPSPLPPPATASSPSSTSATLNHEHEPPTMIKNGSQESGFWSPMNECDDASLPPTPCISKCYGMNVQVDYPEYDGPPPTPCISKCFGENVEPEVPQIRKRTDSPLINACKPQPKKYKKAKPREEINGGHVSTPLAPVIPPPTEERKVKALKKWVCFLDCCINKKVPYNTSKLTDLKKHQKAVPLLQCNYCKYQTCIRSNLASHFESQHRRRYIYGCSRPGCGKQVFDRKGFISHIRSQKCGGYEGQGDLEGVELEIWCTRHRRNNPNPPPLTIMSSYSTPFNQIQRKNSYDNYD